MSRDERNLGADVEGDATTKGYLTFGSDYAYGSISVGGVDRDWYHVHADAGSIYKITLLPRSFDGSSSAGAAFDIRDSAGNVLGTSVTDPDGTQEFQGSAPAGDFFVDVFSASAGGYAVRAEDLSAGPSRSDVPFSTGDEHTGHLAHTGQDDSYTVQLIAGTSYYLKLNSATLTDSRISLNDSLDHVVDSTTASAGDVITYTPAVTGTYTLHVASDSFVGQGDYSLSGGDGLVDFTDTSTHQSSQHIMTSYVGPVAGLNDQEIYTGSDNVSMSTIRAGVFLRGGPGMDGLTVTSGDNILDGSTGSNFLIGGSGHDTFYMDDRNPDRPVFSTVVNFHAGDDVTVWGVNASDFAMLKLDDQGAAGATGLDLIFTAPGHIDTSFVLAGYTSADLSNGRLSLSYGQTPDLPGLPGSQYLTVHAN